MVVDAQLDTPQKGFEILGENLRGGHVHADHAVVFLQLPGGKTLVEPLKTGTDPFVFQHMGGFAQAPQATAQRRSGADGVPIGAVVGQDDIVVMGG